MRSLLSRLVISAVTVLALGCGKSESREGGGSGSAGASSAAGAGSAATPVASHVVEVFVNDASVATITAAQLATWPRVDALLPEADRRLGTWTKLTLVGASATEVTRPSSAFPDKVPVLFPGPNGTASFGMFDAVERAKQGTPAMREDGVREIRIALSATGRGSDHVGGSGEGLDPAKLRLHIETAAGETELTGTQMIELPRETISEQQGWKLSALLAAAGVTTPYKQLLLSDVTGTNIVLPKADFDDVKVIPFVKLNKQGALRFRIYTRQGDGWQASGDLRALSRIKVQ